MKAWIWLRGLAVVFAVLTIGLFFFAAPIVVSLMAVACSTVALEMVARDAVAGRSGVAG